MNQIYRQLAERIRGELPQLERALTRAQDAWSHIQREPENHVYADSAALNLHAFYSGLERVFELVAQHLDQRLPAGPTWQRELLEHMAQDLPAVRPAVISRPVAQALDQLRHFRHLVRNLYATDLEPDRMAALFAVLPGLWPALRAELEAFGNFLQAMAENSPGQS